ncbi:MAG: hypothetical protein WCF60_17435 [Anaerobacillus sp.]
MKMIRRKRDIEALLSNFEAVALYDGNGSKHYIVVSDFHRDGKCTVMKYNDGSFSIHGKGESYCDEMEEFLSREALTSFLWNHRKGLNLVLKSFQKEGVK